MGASSGAGQGMEKLRGRESVISAWREEEGSLRRQLGGLTAHKVRAYGPQPGTRSSRSQQVLSPKPTMWWALKNRC